MRRTFRVNTLKATPEQVKEMLADFELDPLEWNRLAFAVNREAGLGRTLAHFLGLIYVQESASMVPPLVLEPEPGDTVLDIAAAPGSKTTQMAAMMENTGLIIANDVSLERLRGLIGNIDRAGCLNVAVCRGDGTKLHCRLDGTCDRVLVDAPCSAEGTIRRSREALERWSVRGIANFSRIQKRLILAGFRCLKPGGVMVYSTCTIAPEENEAVVAYLLTRQPDALVDEVVLDGFGMRPALDGWLDLTFPTEVTRCRRVLPQDNDTEAFFVARIRRAEGATTQGA
uniref:RsmB/NOP family class I SAM-dependent RNA methyltransferase n=1 Tax=candidate division WOR-3 bacterium TaxID=2052148 RepID=A0A7C4GE70_UNCW3